MGGLLNGIDNGTEEIFLNALEGGSLEDGNPAFFKIDVPAELNEHDLIRLSQKFRQILLTKIQGWAVTAMKLEYSALSENSWKGLTHSYGTVPGLVENVRQITRNLRSGIFRLPDGVDQFRADAEFTFSPDITADFKEVLLGDWFEDKEGHIIFNPEQTIFTLQDRAARVWLQFAIQKGVGYRSALENERLWSGNVRDRDLNEPLERSFALPWLHMDADFNPVKRVGFKTEKGQNGKRLALMLETSPNRSPLEAFWAALSYWMETASTEQGATRS